MRKKIRSSDPPPPVLLTYRRGLRVHRSPRLLAAHVGQGAANHFARGLKSKRTQPGEMRATDRRQA